MRRNLLLIANFLFACRSPAIVEVSAPADISTVALVVLDESDHLLESSPLSTWTEGQPLPIVAEAGSRNYLVGYTAAQLEPYSGAEGFSLREATGCVPRLPEPAWLAHWSAEDRLVPAGASTFIPLTADFTAGVCPDLSQSALHVQLRCDSGRCPATITGDHTCDVPLELSTCGLGSTHAVFDARGNACLELATSGWSCLPTTSPGAAASYDCSAPLDCRIDLFVAKNAIDPPFDEDSIQLFGSEIYLPPRVQATATISVRSRYDGRAYDFVALGDRVAIAASPNGMPYLQCPGDESHVSEQLMFFDAESLAPVGTATAPRCLQRMIAARDGGSFYATFEREGQWMIGRFDRQGRLLHSGPSGLSYEYRQVDDFVHLDGDRLALLGGVVGGSTYVLIFDAATLEPRGSFELSDGDCGAIAVSGGDRLAVASNRTLTVYWLDASDGSLAYRNDLPFGIQAHASLFDVLWDEPTGKLITGARGEADVFAFREGVREVERARVFGGESAELTFVHWPPDRQLILSGGTSIPEWKAHVALLDPQEMRFLPGTFVLGEGIVGRMRADDRGRVWVLLPWAGRLSRLTPKLR